MRIKRIDKSWAVFLLFFYSTIFNPYLEKIISPLKFLDEAIAALSIPLLILELAKTKKLYISLRKSHTIYIWLFAFIGIAGNVVFRYQPFIKAVLPDLFLCMKYWLAMYTGSKLFRNFRIERNAKHVYFHVRFLTWFYVVLLIADIALGGIFTASIRYGFRATQLFYDHPTIFVASCVFLMVLLLSIRNYVDGCDKY